MLAGLALFQVSWPDVSIHMEPLGPGGAKSEMDTKALVKPEACSRSYAGVAIFACQRGAQTGAGCSGSVASSPPWPRAKLLRLVVGTAVDQTALLQAQLWTCQLHCGHNYKLDHSAVEPTVHLAALLWNTSR